MDFPARQKAPIILGKSANHLDFMTTPRPCHPSCLNAWAWVFQLERGHSLYERLKARSIEAASRYDCGARVPEMLAALEPAAATG